MPSNCNELVYDPIKLLIRKFCGENEVLALDKRALIVLLQTLLHKFWPVDQSQLDLPPIRFRMARLTESISLIKYFAHAVKH